MNNQRLILFRILDFCCIMVALSLCSWLLIQPDLNIFSDYTGASTFTVLSLLTSLYMLDCYLIGKEEFKESIIRVAIAIIIGLIVSGFIFYSFEKWRFPRGLFIVLMIINFALCASWRSIYFLLTKNRITPPEKVIFLGAAKADRARRVLQEYVPETRILGYVGKEGADPSAAGIWLGEPAKIFDLVKQYQATKVLVIDADYMDHAIARDLFAAKLNGLKVEDMRSLYERLANRVPIDLIEDKWLLLADGFNLNVTGSMRRLKRAFDICFSLGLLITLSPIILAACIAVRLESKGPAIYAQKRVGLHRREFTIYKIRSMRQDAEAHGAVWAQKNDSRITRVGKFIRKTRIDELPQLINVLKGDMSVIGPRPERMQFVEELEEQLPYYSVRHTVKPGITGWAQVCYPYGASIEDSRFKLEYDLYYIKHLSAVLETKIILRTIGVVLFPKGAR